MCFESKILKSYLESIKVKLDTAVIAVISLKKEAKETNHKFEKKSNQMEAKIKALEECKSG